MIVFFEGVDGGGKTTLLQQLKKTFPDAEELIWPGRRDDPQEFLETAKKFIEENKDKVDDGKLYFMDRCGLGEFLYGPLTKGRKMAKTSEYAEVFKDFLKGKLVIVCLNPDAHDLAMKRGEDGPAADETFHKYVTIGYKALSNGTGLHLIGYNWQMEGHYEMVVGAILAHRVLEVMKYDDKN